MAVCLSLCAHTIQTGAVGFEVHCRCACASTRHRSQPIVTGYSRPSSWPTSLGMATLEDLSKIRSDYGCLSALTE